MPAPTPSGAASLRPEPPPRPDGPEAMSSRLIPRPDFKGFDACDTVAATSVENRVITTD